MYIAFCDILPELKSSSSKTFSLFSNGNHWQTSALADFTIGYTLLAKNFRTDPNNACVLYHWP